MSAATDAEGPGIPDEFFDEIFWTPPIDRHSLVMADRISKDHCGCGVFGVQRVGKSHFASYLEKSLPDAFGGRLIVVKCQFIGQSFTKREDFLKRALTNLGVRAITGRECEPLRLKLVSAIQARYLPGSDRIVFIWDEFQNLQEELWGEIMAVDEAVRADRMKPFHLCIGQPELQTTIDNAERQKRYQAVGRMFQTAEEFRGLTMDDVRGFLKNLDGDNYAFTQKHFPERAPAGWRIERLVEPIQDAVNSLANWSSLGKELCIPASTLRQTLNALFLFLKDKDNRKKEVTAEVVLEAFKDNGFKRLFPAYAHPLPPAGSQGGKA